MMRRLLDTLHMTFVSHFVYILVVSDFGNVADLGLTPWSLAASTFVSLTSDTIVRGFFVRRAWYLSQQNLFVIIFLMIPTLTAFVATLVTSVNVTIVSREGATNLQRGPPAWMLDLTFASSGVADFCIAATLCFCLSRSRNEYFEGTNTILNILYKYTINTGLVATIWAFCCLIANVMVPLSFFELTFYLPLSKVYVNAFLGSLDVRDSLRERSKLASCTRKLSPIASTHSQTRQGASACTMHEGNPRLKAISIRVDFETESCEDAT